MNKLLDFRGNSIENLIENRFTLTDNFAELNIFETFEENRNFHLMFSYPVLTSMLTGKKIMHIPGMNNFDYSPGESLLIPANMPMNIDFPEAYIENPTRCIALTISPDFIKNTVDLLNENLPKLDNDNWIFQDNNFLFRNDYETSQLIDKLIRLFNKSDKDKSIFINLGLQELILRLMQFRTRNVLLDNVHSIKHDSRISFVVQYIKANIYKPLNIKNLANIACLSEPHLFRLFKLECGISPIKYILKERINYSKNILLKDEKTVADACYESGFNNLGYYINMFKSFEGITPKKFKTKNLKN